MAMEESRVLIWHRDKLRLSIINDSFLRTVFDHILGKDVVKKLMQVTQVSDRISGFLNGKLKQKLRKINKMIIVCVTKGE